MDFDKHHKNRDTIYAMLNKLLDDCIKLRDTFFHDLSVGDNDYANLRIYLERLLSIKQLMLIESDFVILLLEISDTENDKALFLVEKALHNFVDVHLLPSIDRLIEISKTWRFEDYRAINFQQEVKEKMTELLNFYNEIYK